jgi:hypothetical protein
MILYSRADTIRQYERLGMIDLLKSRAEAGVAIKILIDIDPYTGEDDVKEFLKGNQHIEVRNLRNSIHAKLMTIVTDRDLSLSIEERGDGDGMGFATFSNGGPTRQEPKSLSSGYLLPIKDCPF